MASAYGVTTSSSPSKLAVPRLPLEIVLTSKDGSTPRQPLTCGSDRSCVTRTNPTNTLPDTPGEGTRPPVQAALPLPPLPIGAVITRADSGVEDPQNREPWSPHSPTGFSTPRTDLSLAKLTLASPRSGGSLQTPIGSPLLSPHSPKSPSMMSPMRLVGTRSPCSVRLSNGSTRLGRDGNVRCTSGGTLFTSPRGSGTNTTNGSNNDSNATNRPRKPHVSRALPFTQPTPAAELSASQTLERFQIPHLNGRELSFSDLLDPSAKDRVYQRMHHTKMGTTMPLSFVNQQHISDGAAPALLSHPTPIAVTAIATKAPASGGSSGGRGGIPTSPIANNTLIDQGQATPRKRPRKNIAPQRADFGADDGCGNGSGSGSGRSAGSLDHNNSSHGETSGGNIGTNTQHNNNNANNNAINNGIASMAWEREDVHTSPLKKNQHATSNRTNTRRNNNNAHSNINNASFGASAPTTNAFTAAVAAGKQQTRGSHKRDHQ